MRAIAEVTTSEGRLSINKKRDLVERDMPLAKKWAYGATRDEWLANEAVPEDQKARARTDPDEEFRKHLDELVRDGRRPIVIGASLHLSCFLIIWQRR